MNPAAPAIPDAQEAPASGQLPRTGPADLPLLTAGAAFVGLGIVLVRRRAPR